MTDEANLTHHTPIWVDDVLWALDIATGTITVFNVLFLRFRVPYVNQRAWDRRSKVTVSTTLLDEDDPLLIHQQNTLNRKSIQKYFYLIAVIPLFVSICAHCGARFPHESIWIFPGMNIVIAIAYLLFIKMMIISCDGWSKMKCILSKEPDECRAWIPLYEQCVKRLFCRCFLRKNAYFGLYSVKDFNFLSMTKSQICELLRNLNLFRFEAADLFMSADYAQTDHQLYHCILAR